MADTLTELADGKDEAAKWLGRFIKSDNPSDRDLRKARILTSHRGTQVRAHSAIIARERAKFGLAKLINGNGDEMKKYLEAATPKK